MRKLGRGMKMTTESKARIGFGIGLVFLLLTSGVAYWSANRSLKMFREVERAERVLNLLQKTLTAMLDVETGARGFILSGQEQFLDPLEDSDAITNQLLPRLREITSENPEQQALLDRLAPMVRRKFDHSLSLIEQREASSLAATAQELAKGEGKQIMDSIRETIAEMQQVEQRLHASRTQNAEETFGATLFLVSLSGLLAFALGGAAAVVIERDLRKRRQAEEERDRFFTLSRDLVCFAGFDGYFKILNPAWESVLGHSREELKSRPFMEFVHPDDVERTTKRMEHLRRGEEVIEFENRYRAKDGAYRWLSWNARASLPDKTVYATARDVTEQKQTAEEIARLNADLKDRALRLEIANQELESFGYSVSHDLRAPLRHIDGFARLLRAEIEETLNETERHYLDEIAQSAKHMGTLIDELLVFSRMGRSEMQQERVNLESVVHRIIENLEQDTAGRKVVWKNGHLPEVQGDPAMLRQVLINLLSNAVKYTRPREVAEIEIGCQENPGEFVVFVRDNGVGFDMEYAHKLFGVFQRLHRAEDFEGTGVGLANVRRIISRHGGRTWAESQTNSGATFYFSLPKKAAA